MYQETAYFSLDYETEVESLADPGKMAAMSKIVQFEHTSTVSTDLVLSRSHDEGVARR